MQYFYYMVYVVGDNNTQHLMDVDTDFFIKFNYSNIVFIFLLLFAVIYLGYLYLSVCQIMMA